MLVRDRRWRWLAASVVDVKEALAISTYATIALVIATSGAATAHVTIALVIIAGAAIALPVAAAAHDTIAWFITAAAVHANTAIIRTRTRTRPRPIGVPVAVSRTIRRRRL
jgi:hypothetical protein